MVRFWVLAALVGILGFRLDVVGLGPSFALFGVGLLFAALTLPVALITALVTVLVARRVPEAAMRAGLATARSAASPIAMF